MILNGKIMKDRSTLDFVVLTVLRSFNHRPISNSVVRPDQGSINDHLESLFENFPNEAENSHEIVQNEYLWYHKDTHSYFLPKLTNEELKLIEEKNQDYLNTFGRFQSLYGISPDVDLEEMKKSESKDKYVHCKCLRRTIRFTLGVDEKSAEVEEKCCCNLL